MKYSISINQKALMELTPGITIKEAVVLEAIINMCNSRSEKINKKRVDGMTWVNYKKILNDLPILHSKSRSTITPKIENLEKYGYIKTKKIKRKKYVELTSKVDRLQYDNISKGKEKLFGNQNKVVRKSEQGCSEMGTNYNTTNTNINNTLCEDRKKTNKKSKEDKEKIPYKEIIENLNEVTGRDFKYTTQSYRDNIKARWNEGYTDVEVYKGIHLYLYKNWGDTKYEKYIRPSTIYRKSKFPKYVDDYKYEKSKRKKKVPQKKKENPFKEKKNKVDSKALQDFREKIGK